MNSVKNNLKKRMLMTALGLAMALGVVTFNMAPNSYACPSRMIEITYYTDASMTIECGYKVIPCNCAGTVVTGRQTRFFTTEYDDCL